MFASCTKCYRSETVFLSTQHNTGEGHWVLLFSKFPEESQKFTGLRSKCDFFQTIM